MVLIGAHSDAHWDSTHEEAAEQRGRAAVTGRAYPPLAP